jgi:hypothetical protein
MLGMHHHQSRVRCFAEDAAQWSALAQHYAGVHDIPVAAIVGSVGRAHELRSDFLPIQQPHGDERYRRVRMTMEGGANLPAIEVYRLGERYYVLDGHHRVAAARATGILSLDAIVVAFEPVVHVAPHPVAA